MQQSTVLLANTASPVFFEVESGYATIGSFAIAIRINGQDPTEIYPNRVKRVHDNVPDIFVLPIPWAQVTSAQLIVYGKYHPAPFHRQVRVQYNFVQDGRYLSVDPIFSNIIEEELDNQAKGYLHSFTFQL
jgi:hypothetical protein